MAEVTRKPFTIRLSDEDIAQLPPAESISESVRQLITDHVRHGNRLDAVLDQLATLKGALERQATAGDNPEDRSLHAPNPALDGPLVALRMILFNLRAVYEGTLRTEAVTTAALHGIVDPDVTGEALEGLLKTRFDAHMSQLWPRFVAENDRGLRSLEGEKRTSRSVEDPTENSPQSRVGKHGRSAAEAADDGERAATNPA
jgi:hypothetical protein